MSATRNRELSQFGSFIHIDDNNKSIGITTGATPFVGIGTTNATSKLHVVGVVSATSFSGSGTALTGIVTSIVAGTNVTVSGSTGQVTINSTASGGGDSSQWVTTDVGIHTLSNVGIGTTNPTSKLHVVGNVSATAYYGNGSNLTGLAPVGGINVSDDTETDETRYILFDESTSGSISGINVSSSKLTFNPLSGALSAKDFNSTSDINLKENIKTIENSLNTIEQLRGVTFNWKENQKPSLGVIAQEVQEILPELVNNGTIKSVNYNGIIGVLIEAIKELKKEVEELKNTKYI